MECEESQEFAKIRRIVLATNYELKWLQFALSWQRLREVLEREGKFSPDQPRVPGGQTGGGQWTSGSGGTANGSSNIDDGNGAGARDPNVQQALLQFMPVAPIVWEKAAEAAVYLYLYLASRNSADATAVLEFNAREFLPGATEGDPAIEVRQLSREETDASCPRHGLVQSLTDQAANTVTRNGNYWSAAVYGTKVHTKLRDQIRAVGDPNLRTEVSAIKSIEAGYGKLGTVRVDVLERVGDGTVCVYDIKTGKSRLTLPRMQEIAKNAHRLYTDTTRLIVIETKPR